MSRTALRSASLAWLVGFGAVLHPFGATQGEDAPPPEPTAGAPAPESIDDKPQPVLDPGHDEEGGPASDPQGYARMTPPTEAELDAADPNYRHWSRLIRDGQADKRVMRLHYFYRWRAEPFDRLIPADWRVPVFERLRDRERTALGVAQFASRRPGSAPPERGDLPEPPESTVLRTAERLRGATQAAVATAGVSPVGRWVDIGPYDLPGRMTGLAQPDGQADVLFATAADGGVWVTRDAGATWETLTDYEITLAGGAILLDPVNPNVIYFGTGEGNGAIDNYPGVGVLKSVDGGLTWTASQPFATAILGLAMHRDVPDRIFAAATAGCFVSHDGGATFSEMGGGLPGNSASAILVDPTNPDRVYCAIASGSSGDIYRSTDGGQTWQALTTGLPQPASTGRVALALSRNNPQVLIAGMSLDGGAVYRSLDGGESWTDLSSPGFCSGQCWYDIAVAIDPQNPDVLYAGGINTWGSFNGGASWVQISSSAGGRGAPNYVHVDQHAIITPTAGEVILANDGGIYRSTDYGGTWDEWSQGMATTQYYGICRHATDPDWAFGGTQDNGSHRRRADPHPTWAQVLGADGGMCMTGPPASDIVIGEYQNHNMVRSTNDGANWSSGNVGIGNDEPSPWVGLMVSDPTNRQNMWTTTDRVYRSMDALATPWVAVSAALAGNGLAATAIEVSPFLGSNVYVGYGGGRLFRTSNALGATVNWTEVTGADWPSRSVRRIRLHPGSPQTVYAVLAGYGPGKIWKSVDRGQTWTERTGDLPDVPVNDLLIDADNPGTLLAATDLGVFRSDDDGVSWYGFSTGLPTAAAIEFTHDRTAGRLRVGTHGRSMWDWHPAVETAVAVPDGALVPGTAMRAWKLADGGMRVTWDTRSDCTAPAYVLLYGDLSQVASRTYSGAVCDLGLDGVATLAQPPTASGSAFFVVVATDGAGTEGPHGFDTSGTPVAAAGAGFCGIVAQDVEAACP